MGTGFQNLEVWREAKMLAVDIYKFTTDLRDFCLRDPMRRAAVSIASNIAEGDERDTDKDSVRFFFMAKGSLAELRTQLEIATDVGLITSSTTAPLLTLGKRLGALIKSRSTHV
jgi:four helix bundle protein